jgi:hypothetical protein
MIFVDFVPVGVVAGLLLGGSIRRLADFRMRSLWLAFAAIGLQLVAFPSGVLPWSTPDGVARVLWVGSYGLLAALVFRNVRVPGVALVGIGQVCNLVAILANAGHMPVTRGALEGAGLSYSLHNNSISLVHPHLSWLVDRWAVPGWVPLGNVYSVGDVVIGVGVLVTLALAMRPTFFARTSARGTDVVAIRLAAREAGILAAARDLQRQRLALAQREHALERREIECERREIECERQHLAAAFRPRSPRDQGEWKIETLEHLTTANADAFPERADEWRYTLQYLRLEARGDGVLPRRFNSVVEETFGELLTAA